ncbi:MAG: diphosphomevalonate decarboxylase, partial [Pseudomonadota bacterium]
MAVRTALAQAQPNIALVKYWGKKDIASNLPAVPSLSITLESLWTRTRVTFDESLESDQFVLNGDHQAKGETRVIGCLDRFRHEANTPCFAVVESENNFPTAAGLASSASGFAALVEATNAALGLELSSKQKSRWARRGSGSAARSIFGGFVEMPVDEYGDVSEAKPLLNANDWPIEVVIAITDTQAKKIGSTEGMQ